MSLTADGSLSNVQSGVSDSRRAITPSKLFNRQTTPQRSGSAPRTTSNNRERIVSDIYLDPQSGKPYVSAPTRPISVRRQRRWENKNMFGLEDFSKSKEDRIRAALEHPDESVEGIPFEISWRSTLSELLKPKNYDLLQEFLSCKDSVGRSKPTVPKDPSLQSDWEVAESAWFKIEKRIRAAVARSHASSEVIRLFLVSLERVILHFAHTQQVLHTDQLCDELKKELARPISIDKSGNLVIPLQESAFRRLLVHGVAQFYGLQSNSVKAKGEQLKACLVRPPKQAKRSPPSSSTTAESDNHQSAALNRCEAVTRCLSMSQYLLLRGEQAQGGYVCENAPAETHTGAPCTNAAHSEEVLPTPETDVEPETVVPGDSESDANGLIDTNSSLVPTNASSIPIDLLLHHQGHWTGTGPTGRVSLLHLQRRMANLTVCDPDSLVKPSSAPLPDRGGSSGGVGGGGELCCESYDCVTLDDGIESHVLVSPQRPPTSSTIGAAGGGSTTTGSAGERGGGGGEIEVVKSSAFSDLDAEYVVVPR